MLLRYEHYPRHCCSPYVCRATRQSTATIYPSSFRVTNGPRRPDRNSLPEVMAQVRRALATRPNDSAAKSRFRGADERARFKDE
jgi:hypothetical protein